jgi:hypothetical protein
MRGNTRLREQITKREEIWAYEMESEDKNEGGKRDRTREGARREGNTRKREQISKRQEIWPYEMESADKNGRSKRQDKRELDEREICEQESR